jgi:hypothetical protein
MNTKNKSSKFLGAKVISPLEEDRLVGGKISHQLHQGMQCQCTCQNGKKCEQQIQEIQNAF